MMSSGAPRYSRISCDFVLVERPLEMRREEAVHHVHRRREAELGDAAQDERLVGGLLRVFAEDDDPARVERAVDIVMSAVHVQRVLGQRARADLEDHRRTLAGRVVILLDAVDDALPRRVVDDALAAHRVRDGAALRGVLAFGFDGDGVAAEDVQLAFRECLLVELAAFGRWRDRIEDAGVGDAGFGVVRDELVAVGRDPDARENEASASWTPSALTRELGEYFAFQDSNPLSVRSLSFDFRIDRIFRRYPSAFDSVQEVQLVQSVREVRDTRALWRKR